MLRTRRAPQPFLQKYRRFCFQYLALSVTNTVSSQSEYCWLRACQTWQTVHSRAIWVYWDWSLSVYMGWAHICNKCGPFIPLELCSASWNWRVWSSLGIFFDKRVQRVGIGLDLDILYQTRRVIENCIIILLCPMDPPMSPTLNITRYYLMMSNVFAKYRSPYWAA